jgi:hypothetical protein
MYTETERDFALGWPEWETQFNNWVAVYGLKRSNRGIAGRNFLADEVMGLYKVGADTVELSAVTMPNLSERDANGRLIDQRYRYVGITWRAHTADGLPSINGGLVETWGELELALAAGPPQES